VALWTWRIGARIESRLQDCAGTIGQAPLVCQAKIPGISLHSAYLPFSIISATQRIRLYTINQMFDPIVCGETILFTSHLFASFDYFM